MLRASELEKALNSYLTSKEDLKSINSTNYQPEINENNECEELFAKVNQMALSHKYSDGIYLLKQKKGKCKEERINKKIAEVKGLRQKWLDERLLQVKNQATTLEDQGKLKEAIEILKKHQGQVADASFKSSLEDEINRLRMLVEGEKGDEESPALQGFEELTAKLLQTNGQYFLLTDDNYVAVKKEVFPDLFSDVNTLSADTVFVRFLVEKLAVEEKVTLFNTYGLSPLDIKGSLMSQIQHNNKKVLSKIDLFLKEDLNNQAGYKVKLTTDIKLFNKVGFEELKTLNSKP